MPSDAELISQILAGRTDVYAVLLKRYERLVRATALRCVRDPHVADDVAQESFVAAFQGLPSLRDHSNFSGWLLSIVRRRGATAVDKRNRAVTTSDSMDHHASASDHGTVTQQSLELLELVDQLPSQERVVIALRHFEGHTVAQIAEITDRPVGTVTKQLSRAHQRLRSWMTESKVEHEHVQ